MPPPDARGAAGAATAGYVQAALTGEAKRVTDLFYLAFVLWREARNETRAGKIALVFSILDRVRNPKWWGNDVPSVCTKKWQYSSMTDPNDKQLTLYPVFDQAWAECISAATTVYDGLVQNPVPGADSYYATYIPAPNWAKPEMLVAQIGAHKFYNTDGNHPENVA
jgi:spore germination cell wall hydrolase CwlJ-like protein